MASKRKGVFSTVKAVKANARIKVGQPKPARIIAEKPAPGAPGKHKTALLTTLNTENNDL